MTYTATRGNWKFGEKKTERAWSSSSRRRRRGRSPASSAASTTSRRRSATSATCRSPTLGIEVERRLHAEVRRPTREGEDRQGDQATPPRSAGDRLPRHRPRPRGRGDRLAPASRPPDLRDRAAAPRRLPRDHAGGREGGVRAPARDRHEARRRAAGPPRPRPAGRLPAEPLPLEEGPPRPLRRARAVRRGAPGRRARARDPGLRPAGVLDDRGRAGEATGATPSLPREARRLRRQERQARDHQRGRGR